MSAKGPKDIPFLYQQRLANLSTKKEEEPKSVFDGISSSLLESLTPTTDHVEKMDLIENVAEEKLEELDAKAKAEAEKALRNKAEFVDYLIERAGYPVAGSDVKYREHFENIIQEEGGIFEQLFLAIKRKLDTDERITEAAKKVAMINEEVVIALKDIQEKFQAKEKEADKEDTEKTEALIAVAAEEIMESAATKIAAIEAEKNIAIKEAREAALMELGLTFMELGAYYYDSSDYYFKENDLVKNLSRDFLQELYSVPSRSSRLLLSQYEKTEGQYKGKKAHLLEALLPQTYHGKISELAPIQEDFDLFLASPTIASLLTRKKHIRRDARADTLENLMKKFRGMKLANDTTQTASQFVDTAIEDFGLTLEDEFALAENGFDGETCKGLNAPEKVFLFKHHMTRYMNSLLEEAKGVLSRLNEEKKAKEEELTTAFFTALYPDTTITSLKTLNEAINAAKKDPKTKESALAKTKIGDVRNNLKNHLQGNEELQSYNAQIAKHENNLNALEADTKEKLARIAIIKETLVDTYYRQVKPSAKALRNAFKELCKDTAKNKKEREEGGTYSCLSFVPVKIEEEGKEARYECLVALSGAAVPEDSVVDPHQLLKDFSEEFNTTVDGKTFTFRYVDESDPALNLALKQLGKGLSGSKTPLSSRHGNKALPDSFEKACAEKRLTQELAKLYSSYGSQIQVLGCDNIALPRYSQATPKSQEEFRKSEIARAEAKEREKAKAAKAARFKGKEKEKEKEDGSTSTSEVEEKESNFFMFEAKVEGEDKPRTVSLKGEHIPCCSSCQAQKPAVMTFLYNGMQRGNQSLREQAARRAATSMPITAPMDVAAAGSVEAVKPRGLNHV